MHAFTCARAQAAVCKVDDAQQQARILDALRREGMGWQLMRVRETASKKPKKGTRVVPSIALCVHGDLVSIKSIAESVRIGTPVLVAKGSGGAADLVADAMLLGRQPRLSMETSGSNPRSAEEAWDALSQCTGASDDAATGERNNVSESGVREEQMLDQSRLQILHKILHPSGSAVEQACTLSAPSSSRSHQQP
jgi:hypothetical protein